MQGASPSILKKRFEDSLLISHQLFMNPKKFLQGASPPTVEKRFSESLFYILSIIHEPKINFPGRSPPIVYMDTLVYMDKGQKL